MTFSLAIEALVRGFVRTLSSWMSLQFADAAFALENTRLSAVGLSVASEY